VYHIIYSGWNQILQCIWSADRTPFSWQNWCPSKLREHFTSAWCGIGRMLNWSSLCRGEWPSHREWKQHSSTLEKPIVSWNWQFFKRKAVNQSSILIPTLVLQTVANWLFMGSKLTELIPYPKAVLQGAETSTATQANIQTLIRDRGIEKALVKSLSSWKWKQKNKSRAFIELIF
jgi:hypothetical protein